MKRLWASGLRTRLGEDADEEGEEGREWRRDERRRRLLVPYSVWTVISVRCAIYTVTHLNQCSRWWYYLYFTVSERRLTEFKKQSESTFFPVTTVSPNDGREARHLLWGLGLTEDMTFR